VVEGGGGVRAHGHGHKLIKPTRFSLEGPSSWPRPFRFFKLQLNCKSERSAGERWQRRQQQITTIYN